MGHYKDFLNENDTLENENNEKKTLSV